MKKGYKYILLSLTAVLMCWAHMQYNDSRADIVSPLDLTSVVAESGDNSADTASEFSQHVIVHISEGVISTGNTSSGFNPQYYICLLDFFREQKKLSTNESLQENHNCINIDHDPILHYVFGFRKIII